jgi:glycosyltransferase involved in cell wall biosynthesis
MDKQFEHIPKDKRKKILLICDDIRVHSGVATVAKEIVIHTCHHFNWVQMAGAIQHPDIGKKLDISDDTNKLAGIEDSFVHLYPTNGYGDAQQIRGILNLEKPDAIFLITDPRYFMHIWNMEHEIRKNIPITYLNIWDDYPAPRFNQPYYEACDLLMGISKQTVNINKLVLEGREKNRLFRYIPHGKDTNYYFPIEEGNIELEDFKDKLFEGKKFDFTMFFNSRNIRRKQIPDTILAFKVFLDSLPKEKADKCVFILKTEVVTDAGTDLREVAEYLMGDRVDQIKFIVARLGEKELNYLYNLSDVQILLTSNEGWGLANTEALLTGTPIIANVTGGMQDQMRFEDENGEWFTPSADIPSNHRGTYKNMENGHFQSILLVDQSKVHPQLLIFSMIDVNGKMLLKE